MKTINVVKVSGSELDDATFLAELCSRLAAFDQPLIVVHGGGKEITTAFEHYNVPSRFVAGLRVTPPEGMTVMEMVVSGSINKRLVARLVAAGRLAVGLSGVDLGVLRAVPYRPDGIDLGRVGTITSVGTPLLHAMLQQGWLPVFAPVALGADDGLAYNVNADHVAQALAAALNEPATGYAAELVFVSNVPGVMVDGAVASTLYAAEIEAAIGSAVISGGMIPKVRSALAALAAGVRSVRITNLAGLQTGGTRIEQ